jgi:hypothetical protein
MPDKNLIPTKRIVKTVGAIVVAFVIGLVPAAAADADTLIDPPRTRPSCGGAIAFGVWAQPGTPRASRRVTITVRDRRTGIVWWHRTLSAPTSDFRRWVLPSGYQGWCGTTVVTFKGTTRGRPWTGTYVVRFRSEGV